MAGPTTNRQLPDNDCAAAALLLAVDSHGLGGAVLRGMPGLGRDRWLAQLRAWLPASAPWQKVPVNVSEDRLLGGLDFAATVHLGRPVFASGLLETAADGSLIVAMAERMPAASAAVIAATLDTGELLIERDGATRKVASRFTVVALDEGIEDEERVSDSLSDRLAFRLSTDALPVDRRAFSGWRRSDVLRARGRLADIDCPQELLESICVAAATFGIESLRAELFVLRAARAAAALRGAKAVAECDVAVAMRLVLPHRVRQLPPDETEAPPPEPPADEPSAETQSLDEVPDEMLVDAIAAAVPPGLLALLQAGLKPRRRQHTGGKSDARTRGKRRGRPVGVQAAETVAGERLNVLATLKAAAPWQTLRRRGGPVSAGRLQLRKEDLQVTRFQERIETTIIFAVDASGSQAAQRLAEVKGAVELLLNDCYVRRDQVALVAFRGEAAEVLLPPTRSLARAKRALAGLPGGGGTPLASGIEKVREMAENIARQGRVPAIVLLTDGRANIALDRSPGGGRAEAEALSAARQLAHTGHQSMLVDTSRRPRPRASALAAAMNARYVPLPHADAQTLSATVQHGML